MRVPDRIEVVAFAIDPAAFIYVKFLVRLKLLDLQNIVIETSGQTG